MISRRRDWVRLGSLVPLLLLAALGRSLLTVDVENLAMKSVGTPAAGVDDLREREFGNAPRLLLLASPRAPEVLAPIDAVEIERWVQGLRERPEVSAVLDAPSPNRGEHCLSVNVLVTEDGKYADAVESLGAAAHASLPPTYRLAIAGVPPVEVAIAREMTAERARILPVIAAGLALVLLVIYRNPVLVLGALLAPLAGVFLLEGLQGLLGLSIDPVSGLLGPSILTVGVASSVHVLERYRHALRDEVSVAAASMKAARELRVPLLLTVATTVAGFLGLLTSPIPAVNRFGLLASVGVVFAVLTTLLCLPSLLRLLHRPPPLETSAAARSNLRQATLLHRRSGPVIGVALLIAFGGAFFMADNRADNNPLQILSADNVVRRDAEEVARRLGGSEVFELLLPPTGPIDPFSTVALGAGVSALDGVVGPAGLPRRSASGYQLLTFLLSPGGSGRRGVLFARAEELANEAGWTGAATTGLSVRMAKDSNELVRSQRRGILMTLAALWLVMAIGFGSVRLGLLGLVPNVLPLLVIQGAMGALDRPLSVTSSMIGAVMLGLVVDDTIHLLHAYRGSTGTSVRRMTRALRAVRRPIVITTTVLCVGFSATIFGELGATREFGALAVATLIVALLADLLLLPALLLWEPPRARRLERQFLHA